MGDPFVLYGRPGSGSLAVQIALEDMGVPYERIWIGREPAEVARFAAINPTGKVPALRLPSGLVLFESAAILIHLGILDASPKLAPASGTDRHALFLQWMTYMSANIYETALRFFYPARYSSRGEGDAVAINVQAGIDYAAHLSFVGSRLAPYVLGGEHSVADTYLYMLVSWLPEKQDLFVRVPELAAHAKAVSERPTVRKVEADHGQEAG